MVDAGRVVDVDAERVGARELERKDLDAGDMALHLGCDLCEEFPLFSVDISHRAFLKKNGRSAPISQQTGEMWWRQC
jgi:hypothetical protein